MKDKQKKLYPILLWVGMWIILDKIVAKYIPFAGPIETIGRLMMDIFTLEFWHAVGNTFFGIAAGFTVSLVLATILGYVAYERKCVEYILHPLMEFLRYIPMITFTLVAVLWSNSKVLAFEVSVFLSFPIIYKQTVTALRHGPGEKIRPILNSKHRLIYKIGLMYNPATMPEYITGCHRALNMCWKSGIIAQMLGHTKHSIGSVLFTARENVDMAAIFSWTIVIVLCSMLFEFVVLNILSSKLMNGRYIKLQDVYEEIEDEDIAL